MTSPPRPSYIALVRGLRFRTSRGDRVLQTRRILAPPSFPRPYNDALRVGERFVVCTHLRGTESEILSLEDHHVRGLEVVVRRPSSSLRSPPFRCAPMFDWPTFRSRSQASEWMDDYAIADERLARALEDLRLTNRLLGAYAATEAVLAPLLRRRDALTVLDLGCGSGDYLVRLVRLGPRYDCAVRAVGVDANPVTVGHARAYLDAQLPGPLRSHAQAEIGDALSLPYDADAFDVTHAALFLHHLHGPDAPALLREMDRVGRTGLVVNDLHRHPLAWAGIWILSRLLRMAPMVQHDGPISVRRGFRREELARLAREADLPSPRIRWHWAFRWTLSTTNEARRPTSLP